MASLIKRIKKGRAYYYIVECQRVNGHPRIVKQIYLGTLEKILDNHRCHAAPAAQEVDLTRLGPMALWDVAVSLGLPEMIDRAFPKRRQGPTMSQFLLLAALGRAFAPCSKTKLGAWYAKTALPKEWGIKPSAFTSQHFWNAMERIDLERLTELERTLSLHIAQEETLAPKALLYDCTNYFTYIDTLNDRNSEAQRGRNKQGRHNLRQVGLAVAVTPDFHIPLFHRLYPGNLNDITAFYAVYDEIVQRMHGLSQPSEELTLILDNGNMSEEMLFLLHDQQVYLVVAASLSDHPEWKQIPLDDFEDVDPERLPGITAWRGKKEIGGYEWSVVVEHSTTLAAKQYHAVATEQAKAIVKLEALAKQLQRRQLPKATVSSITAKVAKILKAQHLKKLITVRVESRENDPLLIYSLNHEALQDLIKYSLGRKALITNRHAWDTPETVLSYRGQVEVEAFFRESKDPDHLSFQPPYHWTDHKLHVHAFYCVVALALTGILRRRLAQQEIEVSTERLLDALHTLQEATLLYPPAEAGPPRVAYCLVRPDALQKQLMEQLEVSKYLHPSLPVTTSKVSSKPKQRKRLLAEEDNT